MHIEKSELASLLIKKEPNQRIFICTNDNHYKVWMIKREGNEVVTKWGRIELSKKLQSKTKIFGDGYRASQFIMLKVSEKYAKGYVEVK